jgi:hypothetical protein
LPILRLRSQRSAASTKYSALPAEGGGARRDRTADLLHAMQALSQLSYGPFRDQVSGINNQDQQSIKYADT